MVSNGPNPLERDFRKAYEHYLAGRFDAAERGFRKVVKQAPAHGDALHLLGLIALRSGNAKAAERRIRQAAGVVPDNPVYQGSLGAALRASGQLEEAVGAYRAAIELKSDYALAWLNLGQIRVELGRTSEAADALREAVRLAPGEADGYFNLANALAALDEVEAAEQHFRKAIELAPRYFEAWHNLANLLAAEGRVDEAVEACREALRLSPDDSKLAVNLAMKLQQAGEPDQAAQAFDAVLRIEPGHLLALQGLADIKALRGDDAGAGELYERLLKMDPEGADSHAAVALWHEYAGRLDQAQAAVAEVFKRRPDHLEGNLLAARIERRQGDLEGAKRRLSALDSDTRDGQIAFELGRVLDRLGDYPAAFGCFTRANRINYEFRQATRFDGGRYLAMVSGIRDVVPGLDAANWPAISAGDDPEDPVFFVGFPRSGTTLMDQMLDAHDGLVSAEEKPMLEAVRRRVADMAGGYPGALADLTEDQVTALREEYWRSALKETGNIAAGPRLVDKLPLNIVHLVLVRRLFPAAKVLVALRDPRDAVLSCFMQNFEFNESMVNFDTVERSAALYDRVMGGWLEQRESLDLDALSYRYEDLVADTRGAADRVFNFLDLPWQDSVLDYRSRDTGRLVTTPSYQDVREAVYDRAVARWRHYEEYLAPVAERLAPYVEAFGYEA